MFYTIEQAKEQVATLEALERLENNEDFKKVIIEGYCQDNADALVLLLSQAANERQYKDRCDRLMAISCFREFLRSLHMEGEQAKEGLNNPETYKAIEESQNDR